MDWYESDEKHFACIQCPTKTLLVLAANHRLASLAIEYIMLQNSGDECQGYCL